MFSNHQQLMDEKRDQYFRNLYQDSIDPIIYSDVTGIIIAANAKSRQMFGLATETLEGLPISALYEDGESFPDLKQLKTDQPLRFNSTWQHLTNKKPIAIEVQVHKYRSDAGYYLQWICHDITKLVQLDNLRQDLTATLVHDLQGPLGNVLSSLELVMNSLKSDMDPVVHDLIDVAFLSSKHLQWLVDTLLDISRLEAGYTLKNLVWVDINELINYVFSVQKPEFEQRQVKLIRSIQPGAEKVKADENILRRVLLNLFNNALKYSEQGQAIRISTELSGAMNELRFCVNDQGQGIPEPFRELVFEKYQQISRDGSTMGLGLGLAFCRLAVEAHGGRIWVEDALDGGASLCFTLPLSGK